jgi:hypothetical protein
MLGTLANTVSILDYLYLNCRVRISSCLPRMVPVASSVYILPRQSLSKG